MVMTNDPMARAPKEIIATAPLDEACRVVISELRTGINAVRNGLALLKREFRSERGEPLTEEQRQQLITMAETGAKAASALIDELLVEGLLRRLEILEAEWRSRGEQHE
jgi:signal transduction histidine kinase